jgi:hypothetical protein
MPFINAHLLKTDIAKVDAGTTVRARVDCGRFVWVGDKISIGNTLLALLASVRFVHDHGASPSYCSENAGYTTGYDRP